MGKRARRRNETVAQAAAATMASSERFAAPRPTDGRPKPPVGPEAPWHPVPVTEVGFAIGGVVIVVGAFLGQNGALAVGGGLLIVTLASLELCIREHFKGYRPHVLFLAIIPTVTLQTLVLLAAGGRLHPVFQLAGDVVVFVALVFVMRHTFKRARPKWLRHLRHLREVVTA